MAISKILTKRKLRAPLLKERGASLIVVMILLAVIAGIGISAVQISIMSERGARNDRDYQVAWQASESALMDAEFDMRGPGTATRKEVFSIDDSQAFQVGCGTAGNSIGLCFPNETGKPVWLQVDFTATTTPPSTEYGAFTSRSFDAGSAGLKPAQKPRYIIEILPDTGVYGNAAIGSEKKYTYRVTAMGFGPRKDIQAVTQMLFRKQL